MSLERRRLMALYGASLELTPREKGMKGAIEKSLELSAATPGSWFHLNLITRQTSASIKKLQRQRSCMIFRKVSITSSRGGTGGHITGVGEVLKEAFPNLKVFAVEPELSPVISGGSPGRILSRASGPVLFQRIFILLSSMVSSRSARRLHSIMRKDWRRKRRFLQGSQQELRWLP